MFKTLLAAAITVGAVTPASAQHHGIIANAETGVPLRDATIYTDRGETAVTDWQGAYAIDSTFLSATIVKSDFVSLTVEAAEMGDTLYLLPKFNTLAEVVVWGKRRFSPNAVKSWQPSFVPAPSPGIGGLDILGLFYRKRPMSKSDVEKHNEIMREY